MFQYLLERLINKKYFNIINELQHANIKKRQDNLKNLLKNNPYIFNISSSSLFPKLSNVASCIKNKYWK